MYLRGLLLPGRGRISPRLSAPESRAWTPACHLVRASERAIGCHVFLHKPSALQGDVIWEGPLDQAARGGPPRGRGRSDAGCTVLARDGVVGLRGRVARSRSSIGRDGTCSCIRTISARWAAVNR